MKSHSMILLADTSNFGNNIDINMVSKQIRGDFCLVLAHNDEKRSLWEPIWH